MFRRHLAINPEDLAKALELVVCLSPAQRAPARRVQARILAATLLEVAEVGFHGATIEGIAARIKMSKAALCYHFHTKDSLLASAATACTRLFSCGASLAISSEIEQLIVTDYLRAALDGFVHPRWDLIDRPIHDLVRRIHLSANATDTLPEREGSEK
jgi:AcrR family transcriptional regulator